jgi:hypothetical protein
MGALILALRAALAGAHVLLVAGLGLVAGVAAFFGLALLLGLEEARAVPGMILRRR